MTTQAVKQWIYDRVLASATAAPGGYPRDACAGILAAAGQVDGINTTILKERPVQDIQAETLSVIMMNIPGELEAQISSGGISGQFRNDVDIQFDLIWVANFTGDPANSIPPTFTDELVSGRAFRKILQALRKTIRYCTYRQISATVIQGWSWVVTDPDDGTISRINGSSGKIRTKIETPMVAENSTDIFYGASLTITLVEMYNGTGV